MLLHFRLRAPVLIGTKNVIDIQLYSETCNLVDDLDSKQRRRMNEQDEYEEEERERIQKHKLNEKYHKFVKAAELLIKEYNYNLEFDVPFKDLEFTGCHAKASVNIVPTS